ncbi:HAD family hydrolase [Streptomyces sp. NPDC059698]|uniref:HAD family hydrolase n=1 Tax=unclassified Streptomyces TaxID=2593676 RepID=UPI00093FB934|nr:HAD-IB family hydrolase [Streptomyces sp. CB02366]OKJ25941.1 hypothetical protein AMK24_31505 [Streptomyces sp. CB02366]
MRAAFFDVDGTLTADVTAFRFLEYWFLERGASLDSFLEVRRALRDMTIAGISRDHVSRAFFRQFTGVPEADVDAAGRRWFAAELSQGGFFNEPVLAAVRQHRESGDLVVLVSGSFPPFLMPLAEHVAADRVLCTRPLVADGVYTGEIGRPLLGERKAAAVSRLATERRISLTLSSAYGDHRSDLEMLRSVGDPVLVGDAPQLVEMAHELGWRRLPRPGGWTPVPRPRLPEH